MLRRLFVLRRRPCLSIGIPDIFGQLEDFLFKDLVQKRSLQRFGFCFDGFGLLFNLS